MKILVLGASGMVGNALLKVLSKNNTYDVYGSSRNNLIKTFLPCELANKIIAGIDIENIDMLSSLLAQVKPNVVINCVGIIKQLEQAKNPLCSVPVNVLLPHRLSQMCALIEARLIHFSTDCVFSGRKGNYLESDETDALDFYGRSKLLGEVYYPNTITLRTSVIGHELNSTYALIDWFLSQKKSIKGYTRMIFSGLPSYELAKVVGDFVIPKAKLNGLYHVGAKPISKFELLRLVKDEYKKDITIDPDDKIKIDRSLNSNLFQRDTGYIAPSWIQMISEMYSFYKED